MRLKVENSVKNERLNLRGSLQDVNKIQTKANLYTEGNISEYMIYAALNFVPSKDDLQKSPPKRRASQKSKRTRRN